MMIVTTRMAIRIPMMIPTELPPPSPPVSVAGGERDQVHCINVILSQHA